ncbi:MAG: flippase-like domain-containing protein [Candidatus Omnitrophica bacterium]|nr:flippase-like domain-containing protein [Candidatus Omnitrophota bacterium]
MMKDERILLNFFDRHLLRLILSFIIILAVTCVIFYYLKSVVDFQQTFQLISRVKSASLLTGIAISILLNIFLCAFIKQTILAYMNYPMSYMNALFIRCGSLPYKLIPTVKNTEIFSVYYLKKYHHVPLIEGLLSNVIANIIHLITILIFFALGCLLYGMRQGELIIYQKYFMIMAVMGVVVMFSLCLFILKKETAKKILFLFCFARESRLFQLFKKNIDLWHGLSLKKLLFLLVLSMGYQISELLICFVFARSYGLVIPLGALFLYMPLVVLLTQLPVSISGFGVREGAYIIFLAHFAPKETLLALGLLVFFVHQIVPVLLGLLFFVPFSHKLQFSDVVLKE